MGEKGSKFEWIGIQRRIKLAGILLSFMPGCVCAGWRLPSPQSFTSQFKLGLVRVLEIIKLRVLRHIKKHS